MRPNAAIVVITSGILLTACAGGTSKGPDEFGVLPTKPLEQPEDYSYLPAPKPGVKNRADKTPNRDAIAALGGRPEYLDGTLISVGEQGLLSTISRYGVDPEIRRTLAAEDREIVRRGGARVLERLVGISDAVRAYEGEKLDPVAEAQRLRAMGIKTPIPIIEEE